jgi:hypothetical protein
MLERAIRFRLRASRSKFSGANADGCVCCFCARIGETPPSLTAITRQASSCRYRLLVAFSSIAGKRRPLAVARKRTTDVTKKIPNDVTSGFYRRNSRSLCSLLERQEFAISEASRVDPTLRVA